jgi:hypothetical protein
VTGEVVGSLEKFGEAIANHQNFKKGRAGGESESEILWVVSLVGWWPGLDFTQLSRLEVSWLFNLENVPCNAR